MKLNRTTGIVSGVVAAVTAVGGGGYLLLGPGELGREGEPSSLQVAVEKDPSWLGYMPVLVGGVEPEVTSFQGPEGNLGRSVDIRVQPSGEIVYLCFAKTEQELASKCETGRVLGKTDRDVAEPWIAVVGPTDVDLMNHMKAPIPELEDVPSLSK